jgi:benzoyl-CoA reductase subunit C
MNFSNSWIDPFKNLYKDRVNIATQWKQDGRHALGYIYAHVPEELMHAAGILPVQLLENVGKVVKAFRCIPPFFCYQGLGNLELALTGGYDYLDGIVMSHSCDPIRKVFGIWKNNVPMKFSYFLPLPSKGEERAWQYYKEELVLFKSALEDFTGKKITDEDINRSIGIYNKNRELMKTFYELRKDRNILGSDAIKVVRSAVTIPREMHNDLLERALEEIPPNPVDKKVKKIFVSTLSLNDSPFMDLIEELGARVVFDDLAMGARYHWDPTVGNDPMDALCRRYPGVVPFAGRYPREKRVNTLIEFCKSYGVDGAIIKTEKYCDPYLFEEPFFKERFIEEGIPALLLDFGDIRAEEGRVRTRIQAFLETLE